MNKRMMVWGMAVLIWIGFTLWYTDLGGPLTDKEVTAGIELMAARGYDPARLEKLQRFLRNDSGRQFLMVNNIHMSDNPPPIEAFGPDATATDYLAYYMEHMIPELFSRACHPVFYATGLDFVADRTGIDNAEGWDTAALFRYRSRRDFLDIITHPDIGERHDYKLAAMTKTIAYPVEPSLYLSDLRFLLFLLLGLVTAVIDILVFNRNKTDKAGGRP